MVWIGKMGSSPCSCAVSHSSLATVSCSSCMKSMGQCWGLQQDKKPVPVSAALSMLLQWSRHWWQITDERLLRLRVSTHCVEKPSAEMLWPRRPPLFGDKGTSAWEHKDPHCWASCVISLLLRTCIHTHKVFWLSTWFMLWALAVEWCS